MISIDLDLREADWPKIVPDKIAQLKAFGPTKGGEGSGNFGHAGRPRLVGGSAPSDVVGGESVDDAVKAIEALTGSIKNTEGATNSDDLTPEGQKAFKEWWIKNFHMDEDSLANRIVSEAKPGDPVFRDLVDAARRGIDVRLNLEGTNIPEDVKTAIRNAPDTAIFDAMIGSKEGNVGAVLGRFGASDLSSNVFSRVDSVLSNTAGDALTEAQHSVASARGAIWDETRSRAAAEGWQERTGEERYSYVVDMRYEGINTEQAFEIFRTHIANTVQDGVSKWTPMGFDPSASPSADDLSHYKSQQKYAQQLVSARFGQLLQTNGIATPTFPDAMTNEIWGNWKGDSGGEVSLAFRDVATKTLGLDERYRDDVRAKEAIDNGYSSLRDTAFGLNSTIDRPTMERVVGAYARAQWETTQYILNKSGRDHLDVYRGLIRPDSELFDAAIDHVPVGTHSYLQFTDLKVKRQALQSTTYLPEVANEWRGAGGVYLDGDSSRVVLRMRVPASAVMSLPVFGKNYTSEQEVVVMGTKAKWRWDAWKTYAPVFEQHAIQKSLVYE